MSLLGSIDTPEKFEALWQRLLAEKRKLSDTERREELERDVLGLQVGLARTTNVLAELVKKLEKR